MIALGVHPIMKLVRVVQFSWWLASLLCFLLFAAVEACTSYRPPGEQLLSLDQDHDPAPTSFIVGCTRIARQASGRFQLPE
jgi:hypothetical protein